MAGPNYAGLAVRALLSASVRDHSAHPGGIALSRHLLAGLQLRTGDRVVDVGAGSGATAALLARRGCEVLAVDVEEGALRRARRRLGRSAGPGSATVALADAHALPLAAGAADAIVCECVLSTLADPIAAVTELARVLRPGGLLGLSDVTADRDRLAAAHPGVLAGLDRLTTARPLDYYAGLLDGAGLEVLLVQDRPAEAEAMIRRVRRRVCVASALLPGLRPGVAVLTGAAAAQAEGLIGYAVLVAAQPL